MSRPVDVLGVIRVAECHLRAYAQTHKVMARSEISASADGLRELRTDIDDLVDAASRYYHATTYPVLDGEDNERVARAGSRLAAALAALATRELAKRQAAEDRQQQAARDNAQRRDGAK